MSSSDNAGEEDGEEEDGEISTDLKSKTLVFWTIASVNYQSSKKKKKLCTDMDHCFSELPKELSRSSGETKTPPIYSGETHQRHHLFRRNLVQNPYDHEVQSGRRASIAISGNLHLSAHRRHITTYVTLSEEELPRP
jgi:hypothetical protein